MNLTATSAHMFTMMCGCRQGFLAVHQCKSTAPSSTRSSSSPTCAEQAANALTAWHSSSGVAVGASSAGKKAPAFLWHVTLQTPSPCFEGLCDLQGNMWSNY